MDPTRDNPIIRFSAFWWGIAFLLAFAVLLAVLWGIFGGKPTTDLEAVAAKARYEIRAKVDQEQSAELSKEAIQAAMPAVAKQLANSKPEAASAFPVQNPAAQTPAVNSSPKP